MPSLFDGTESEGDAASGILSGVAVTALADFRTPLNGELLALRSRGADLQFPASRGPSDTSMLGDFP
jgi:hypothetical protein